MQSRLRLKRVERQRKQDECLQKEIIIDQVAAGIIEKTPNTPTGEQVFYMHHKPVIKQDAVTTKSRMVFDASAKPQPISSSVNECMYPGPPLQPPVMGHTCPSTNVTIPVDWRYREGIPSHWP
jgi:hypothetical protein